MRISYWSSDVCSSDLLDTAAGVARRIVARQLAHPLKELSLLNVNIPAVSAEALQGMRITRLGKRHPSEPVVKSSTPYGDPVYWIGPVGRVSDSADDTDFGAVERHAVSITPLRLDLTHHDQVRAMSDWADLPCESL